MMDKIGKAKTDEQDEVLEALFRHASTRPRAPLEVENEIRAKLQGEWREMARQRKRRRQVVAWAVAASVVLAISVSAVLLRQTAPMAERLALAAIEKRIGEVFVLEPGKPVTGLTDSAQLSSGNELFTGTDSRIALTWANGESLRLDQHTRITLSPAGIRLQSGNVYVDSAAAKDQRKAFIIDTPSGPVTHLGTRYMTSVDGEVVTVRVRDGEVSVGGGDDKSLAIKGQELRITAAGLQSMKAVKVYGEQWQWVEQVAPGFDMEGRALKEFLDWVARETGMQIEYASAKASLAASSTLLHGHVDLQPLRALELVMQTSDLTPVVGDGVIMVSY